MSQPFKVVIVGGGVGGLALALTLAKAGIDYVLLEAYPEIAPDAGASIAIGAGGARTLDQIGGVLEDLLAISTPLGGLCARDDKGKPMYDYNLLRSIDRHGYQVGFLPRQDLLALFYKHVPEKSKILPGKRVVKVIHSDTGVRVITKDGEEFAGDIVVGVDGVHSVIRQEMWALADELSPGLISDKEKQDTLSAEYCTVVGLATPHPGLEDDYGHILHNYGRSGGVITGYGGRIFWFLFEKLDKVYKLPNIPKFTVEDGRKLAEKRLEDAVTEDVKFGELWDRTTSYVTVPMEEGCFEHWHYKRMIVIGDAAHKFTINLGLGANAAIESAAALTNGLYHALKAHPEGLSTEMIDKVFKDVQAHRKYAIEFTDGITAESTRMQAWATKTMELTTKYIVKNLIGEDYLWDLQGDIPTRTERLDFLPDSDKGAIPMVYSPRYPNKRAKLITGIAYTLPAFALLGCYLGVRSSALIPAEVNEKISRVAAETGIPSFGIYSSGRFGLAKIFTSCFSSLWDSLTDGSDKQLDYRLKIVAAQTALGLFPILTIMIVESLRRGNTMTLSKIPTFWGFLYQIFPISIVLPVYFFFHAYQITPAKYYEKNFISIPMAYAKSLIPTLIISFLIPTSITLFREQSLRASIALWLPFPIYAAIVHQILKLFFTTPAFPKKNADLPYTRGAYLLSFGVSALAHLYALYIAITTGDSFSITARLAPGTPPTHNSFVETGLDIVRSEHLVAFAAGLAWVLILLNDMKRFRKTAAGWLELLGYITAASVIFGPAATVLAAYAWREELLRV
ncbi:hypothetical protein B9Z19DRAFT_1190852 [Tuber borchii]|uniref:FAD-binding domain-containing protein n=1 Tax=Tuber borchii TaxID=42251 RepID=A0A2T7A2F3_TUBBO|nr:hypothetical protein B9Z19DRAFT_1190852 [Tuber borchii]